MGQTFLGLDIGDRYIKAVVASRMIRGGVSIDYCALRERASGQDLTADLASLFADHEPLRDIPCITALSTREVLFRVLTFPFHDGKKIRQTLNFEIEPLIPVPIDEMLVDYVQASRTGDVRVLAAAVPKKAVQGIQDSLSTHVREIAALDIEAVPLFTAFLKQETGPGVSLLLDVGSERTVVLFVKDYCLFQVREFPFGIDRNEANGAGQVGGDKRDGDKGAGPSEHFCRELRHTIELLQWQGMVDEGPARIFLAGGGASMPGLQQELSRAFSIPVSFMRMMEGMGPLSFTEEAKKQWVPTVMDQALALAVRPLKEGMGFDFRRRQQREGKGYGHIKKDMRLALMAAGLVFIMLGADTFLDYYIQKNRLAELKARIQTVYRQYNPDGGRIVEPLSQMRAKIAEMRKMALGSAVAATDLSTLDVLKEISGLIPPAMEVLITSWTMEQDNVVIKGEAKNFDTIQMIRNELVKSKRFRSVNIGTTTMMKQGEKVEFDLKVTLK
ncbi:MAG: hypothetical protein CSYNP_02531 [Syntrophus sp. SKADARSKE-3]|nr:hypothetical protein [Syntrophus sp. SKADARSKE-3]